MIIKNLNLDTLTIFNVSFYRNDKKYLSIRAIAVIMHFRHFILTNVRKSLVTTPLTISPIVNLTVKGRGVQRLQIRKHKFGIRESRPARSFRGHACHALQQPLRPVSVNQTRTWFRILVRDS